MLYILYSYIYRHTQVQYERTTRTGVSGSNPVAPDAKLTPVRRSSGLRSTPT
jgi:hypothetical protein